MNTKLQLLAACALMTSAIGCGNKDGGDLATVNGDPISRSDFHSYLERKPRVTVIVANTGRTADAPVAGTLGFQAMRDLINRRLLLQLAKDEGVMPTVADVEKEIVFQKKSRPEFIRELTSQGLSIEEIKNDLTIDLAQERLLGRGITVSAKDVDAYIKANPKQFITPPQVSLLWIVVDSPSLKQQVDNDLKTGQSFRTVAQQYSIAPDARRNNGRYPLSVVDDKFPARLKLIVAKTNELESTEWLQDGNRWVKFFVEKKAAAKAVKIDDTMREKVRRALTVQRGAAANDLGKKLQTSLRDAKVDVKDDSLKAFWKRASENMNAQDAQRGTGGTKDRVAQPK